MQLLYLVEWKAFKAMALMEMAKYDQIQCLVSSSNLSKQKVAAFHLLRVQMTFGSSMSEQHVGIRWNQP